MKDKKKQPQETQAGTEPETAPVTGPAAEGPQPQPEEEKTAGAEADEAALKLAEAEKKLEAAEKQSAEYLDMAQRLQAEFDNYRRRTNTVRADAWEDGARETISLMLPVLDNLERAIGAAGEAESALKSGVELVLRQMLEILDKRGVTVIDRVGEVFDPELENAVAQADASEGKPGTVCTVLQKGYKTKNKVIRHAMVRVVVSE